MLTNKAFCAKLPYLALGLSKPQTSPRGTKARNIRLTLGFRVKLHDERILRESFLRLKDHVWGDMVPEHVIL